jgi:hypothetical protein
VFAGAPPTEKRHNDENGFAAKRKRALGSVSEGGYAKATSLFEKSCNLGYSSTLFKVNISFRLFFLSAALVLSIQLFNSAG